MAKKIDFNDLSDRQIVRSFYSSQAFLLLVSALLFWLFHVSFHPLPPIVMFDMKEMILWGVIVGALVAGAEYVLSLILPPDWMDDGGVNQRLFAAMSIKQIVMSMLLVAVIEEWLFRGLIQTYLGWIVASVIFGVVHIRYLRKPVMLIIVLLLGVLLGYIFKTTGSLWPPMICHYVIDVLLGVMLKMSMVKRRKEGKDLHE